MNAFARQQIPTIRDQSPHEQLIALLDAASQLTANCNVSIDASTLPGDAETTIQAWASAHRCVLQQLRHHTGDGLVQRRLGIYTQRPAQVEIANFYWPPEPDPDVVRDCSYQIAQEREDLLEQDRCRAELEQEVDIDEELRRSLSDDEYVHVYGRPRR